MPPIVPGFDLDDLLMDRKPDPIDQQALESVKAEARRKAKLTLAKEAREKLEIKKAKAVAKLEAELDKEAKINRKAKPTLDPVQLVLARKNFVEFLQAVWISNGKLQVKWFHRYIAEQLDSMSNAVKLGVEGMATDNPVKLRQARQLIRRLSLSIPCQHGKSELGSVYFPAFVFGLCPDARIIFGAATSAMAVRWSRKIQKVMMTAAYTEIFPKTRLRTTGNADNGAKVKRTDSEFEIIGYNGSFLAMGVGGAIGGNPADLYIIDDPAANTETAHSPTERDKHWDWYTEDVTSRGHNDYAVLLVASRRHPDDLQGRVRTGAEKHPDKANPWTFVVIRAIKEENDFVYPGDKRKVGEALWAERHDIDRLRQIEQANSWNFQSQYQQNPLPDGGVIFRIGYFKRWGILPETSGEWLSSWDCSSSSGNDGSKRSHSVGQVWFRPWGQGKIFLVDQSRGQWTMPELRLEFRKLEEQYPNCRKHLIEAGGFGKGVAQDLADNGILGIQLIRPTKSKALRAQEVLCYFAAGNVYLPVDDCRFPWVAGYLIEMTRFTGGNNEINDQVDATTQALSNLGPILRPSYDIDVMTISPADTMFGYSR